MESERDGVEQINHGERLGAWVRERRKALDLTQEQVTGRMGIEVPGNFVTQLENGARKRMIGQPRLGQLARALRASEVDLLRGAGVITEEAEAGQRPPASELDEIADRLSESARDTLYRVAREFDEQRRGRLVAEAVAISAPSGDGFGQS